MVCVEDIRMIKYYKLFDLLQRREMTISDLRPYIASTSLTKLKKGEIVQTDVINRICWLLNCQPADIMEYIEVPNEKIFSNIEKMQMAFDAGLKYYDNKSIEDTKKVPPFSKQSINDGIEIIKKLSDN